MRDKPPISLPDDVRARGVASIRRFFADELDREIGDLKAMLVLDYVLAEFGPTIYNQAIGDARTFFEERAADLDAICYLDELPVSGRHARRPP
jgi:uncharacterized protein (DUF2164 family)